jgi:hypothetical protein
VMVNRTGVGFSLAFVVRRGARPLA